MPCREQIIERTVQAEAEQLRRYDLPGICPACEEPVSQRQLRQSWPENLVAPTGQPVTFHLRNRCVGEASANDERWRKAGHISMLGIPADPTAGGHQAGGQSWVQAGHGCAPRSAGCWR